MSFGSEFVGTKPSVPKLTPIDVGEEQRKAIANNLAALPSAEALVQAQNEFSREEIKKMLSAAGINYDALSSAIGKNIDSLVRGEIPSDVSGAVQRSDAARAIGGGYAGSEMNRNLVARDLGLVSLDLTGRGLNAAESWLKSAQGIFGPAEMDVKSMFVTPAFQLQADTAERDAQFQRRWLQNQIKAMPAPWAEDLKQFIYRAMSIYSGTPVQNNPYSTPGSFGGGIPSGSKMNYGEGGYGDETPNGYDTNVNVNFSGGGGGGYDPLSDWSD